MKTAPLAAIRILRKMVLCVARAPWIKAGPEFWIATKVTVSLLFGGYLRVRRDLSHGPHANHIGKTETCSTWLAAPPSHSAPFQQ